MFPTLLPVLMTALLAWDNPTTNDVRTLVDAIESLQQPIEDFRCEFEGSLRFKGKVAEDMKVGEDGLDESFTGVFIWKRGGDTHSECLHHSAADNQITRESLVVRMREQQSEHYNRLNDAPLGYAVISNPTQANSWRIGCLGQIFLIDKLKRDVAAESLQASVSDDQIGGRTLKVLSIALKFDSSIIARYWIDLRRNGHVVRTESYAPRSGMSSRADIRLAPFRIGDAEVWMPVSGELTGYAALEDKKPVITSEPTSIETIKVVDGTMEFNRRPGREVFTMKYKPGTPISDNLRKMTYEFGKQKIGAKLTKLEAEKMLNEQVAKAEEQKAELAVASPSEGFDWTSWITWGLSTMVLISSITLWVQRRRH